MRIVSISDFVVQVEELLEPDACAGIVERFEADPRVRPGRVFHSEHGAETNADKHSRDLVIEPSGPWQPIHDLVHAAVSAAVQSVLPSFPGLQVHPLGCTGYKIQMYPKGVGHFRWHFDALGPLAQARVLALVLYLNDVERGGETAFHHQGIAVAPRAGRALLFPAAWTHMHCARVPESGDKYVISSFFEFALPRDAA